MKVASVHPAFALFRRTLERLACTELTSSSTSTEVALSCEFIDVISKCSDIHLSSRTLTRSGGRGCCRGYIGGALLSLSATVADTEGLLPIGVDEVCAPIELLVARALQCRLDVEEVVAAHDEATATGRHWCCFQPTEISAKVLYEERMY